MHELLATLQYQRAAMLRAGLLELVAKMQYRRAPLRAGLTELMAALHYRQAPLQKPSAELQNRPAPRQECHVMNQQRQPAAQQAWLARKAAKQTQRSSTGHL